MAKQRQDKAASEEHPAPAPPTSTACALSELKRRARRSYAREMHQRARERRAARIANARDRARAGYYWNGSKAQKDFHAAREYVGRTIAESVFLALAPREKVLALGGDSGNTLRRGGFPSGGISLASLRKALASMEPNPGRIVVGGSVRHLFEEPQRRMYLNMHMSLGRMEDADACLEYVKRVRAELRTDPVYRFVRDEWETLAPAELGGGQAFPALLEKRIKSDVQAFKAEKFLASMAPPATITTDEEEASKHPGKQIWWSRHHKRFEELWRGGLSQLAAAEAMIAELGTTSTAKDPAASYVSGWRQLQRNARAQVKKRKGSSG